MKKIATALMAVAMTSAALSVNSMAAQHWSDEVTVHAAYGTPVVDGEISEGEWDNAPAINISLNNDPVDALGRMRYQGAWEGARDDADFADTFKIMWDEKNLYVLEKRTDDHVNFAGNPEQPFLTDGTLMFLQMGDDDSALNPEGWVHHLFYIAGNGNGEVGGWLKLRLCNELEATQQMLDVSGGSIVTKKTDDGVLFELAFPWANFASDIENFKGVTAGDELGFSLVLHDNDGEEPAYEKQLCYMAFDEITPEVGYDYGGYGTLVLDAKVEAPAESEDGTDDAAQTSDMAVVSASILAASAAAVVLTKKKKH